MIRLPKSIPGEPSPVVISYLRFSNPEQSKGDSVRRQTAKTEGWASRTGIPLDNSLSFRDQGVSAFRGRNASEGALSQVIDCIESGRIWPGCYLSIESLDRLSRQKPLESVTLMQRILASGVRIVTHTPSERVYNEESAGNTYELLEMVLTFARAHEESETKSHRLKEAWGNKRNVIEKRKLTSISPAWLRPVRLEPGGPVVDFQPIPERVETVRRIFSLSLDGLGQAAICRALNTAKTPTFGRSTKWQSSTVAKILRDRSLLGEHQPHRMAEDANGKECRVPIGEPVTNYFPAVIDTQTFYSVQAAIEGRKMPRGKSADNVKNLFVGLLFDVRDGSSCYVIDKGKRSGGPAIVNSSAMVGDPEAVRIAFPYERFETSLLALITDIDLTAVMPKRAGKLGKQIAEASSEVVAIESRITEIKARTKKRNVGIGTLLDLLAESEAELIEAKSKLDALKRQQASPAEDSLKTTKELIDKLAQVDDVKVLRAKMRRTIRQFVKRIDVLITGVNALDKVLIADIELTNGKRRKLAVETGTPAPDELYELELTDYANWPAEWQATHFERVPDIDRQLIELADKGWQLSEIAKKTGIRDTVISRRLIKYGRRRTSRRSKDSGQLMTWNEASHGWQKTKNCKRFYVGCGTLKELYPRLVKSMDREGTLKAANRWWQEHGDQV